MKTCIHHHIIQSMLSVLKVLYAVLTHVFPCTPNTGKVKMNVKVIQSCVTLCNPMDCGLVPPEDGAARGTAHIPGAHRSCDSLSASPGCPCSPMPAAAPMPAGCGELGPQGLAVRGAPSTPWWWAVCLQSLTSHISGVRLSQLFICLNCHPSGTAPHRQPCLLSLPRP